MAAPKIQNLSQTVGEDKTYRDNITDASGNVVNVTGWGGTWTVHEYGNPLNIYYTTAWTIPSGGTDGNLQAVMPSSGTVNMVPGEYEHAWERTDSGNDLVLTVGTFTLFRK